MSLDDDLHAPSRIRSRCDLTYDSVYAGILQPDNRRIARDRTSLIKSGHSRQKSSGRRLRFDQLTSLERRRKFELKFLFLSKLGFERHCKAPLCYNSYSNSCAGMRAATRGP